MLCDTQKSKVDSLVSAIGKKDFISTMRAGIELGWLPVLLEPDPDGKLKRPISLAWQLQPQDERL